MIFEDYKIAFVLQTLTVCPARALSPVVLTIPHDGGMQDTDLSGFFKPRRRGIKSCDPHTWYFAKEVLLSVAVYAIRGLIPRCYIDYNRSREQAVEDERLLPWYDYYHDSMADVVEHLVSSYSSENILLLDIHNMRSLQPSYGNYDVILGTCNQKTVFSDVAISLTKFLRIAGFRVFLPEAQPVGKKPDLFKGGFTVSHYSDTYKINAIQIEIAGELLATPLSNKGLALAHSIIGFLQLYKAIVRGHSVS